MELDLAAFTDNPGGIEFEESQRLLFVNSSEVRNAVRFVDAVECFQFLLVFGKRSP